MLPKKTFLFKQCQLYESDFDVTGRIKMRRLMELLQDVATTHADLLGFGWDAMDAQGLFWVLSKIKIRLLKDVTRKVRSFTLYTWPVPADRFFIERRFEATDDNGELLFCATSVWLVVERDTRKIASPSVIAQFYKGDFDDTPCSCSADFAKIKRDGDFVKKYSRAIYRSDLDINKHVNNTNYITFATDALTENDVVVAAEITYHKELKQGDAVDIYVKREQNVALIVGECSQTNFTAKLTLKD